jgi:hypothetical protein
MPGVGLFRVERRKGLPDSLPPKDTAAARVRSLLLSWLLRLVVEALCLVELVFEGNDAAG